MGSGHAASTPTEATELPLHSQKQIKDERRELRRRGGQMRQDEEEEKDDHDRDEPFTEAPAEAGEDEDEPGGEAGRRGG